MDPRSLLCMTRAYASCWYVLMFRASRLADFPSLSGSLLALRALLQHHPTPARKVREACLPVLTRSTAEVYETT